MRTRVSHLFWKVSPWILAIAIVLFSALLYLRKTASFRFFDEENNIVAGYLMTQGRALYRDIFMNHNPLPLVISQLLQQAIPSGTLFDLVKLHRVFMVVFALIANSLLLIRFRSKALLFVGAYEYMRFYISGQMFLAEGMMAYMFAYYIFLLIEAYYDKKQAISIRDTVIASFLFAFIVLSREPYVPLVVVLYALVLIRSASSKWAWGCATASFAAVGLFMLQYDLGEFYKQVVTLNASFSFDESKAQNGTQLFSGLTQLYQYFIEAIKFDKPLYIILGMVNMLFAIGLGTIVRSEWRNKVHTSLLLSIVILLAFLAGMRNFGAGVEWFGMYRSIPYIALLVSFVSYTANIKIQTVILFTVILIACVHPRSHFLEERNNAEEYYINYSQSYTVGEIFKTLCKNYSRCTLHIEDIDVYPYMVSNIEPNYMYAFHYPVQMKYLDFAAIRDQHISSHPPTIYYDSSCKIANHSLPQSVSEQYIWLIKDDKSSADKRSCIAIRARELLPSLDSSQKEDLKKHFYSLPSNSL